MDVSKGATVIMAFLVSLSVAGMAQDNLSLGLDSGPGIPWHTDYHEALQKSVDLQKPVLLDFYADWCGPCHMMDDQTYSDPRVIAALDDFIPIKIDTDRNQAVAFAYRIKSIPRTLSLNVHGEIVGDIVGYMDANDFLKFLSDVRKDALTKIDGISIAVPEDADTAAITFNSGTPKDELFENLTGIEPEIRKLARAELVSRNDTETRQILLNMLSSEYLGARIAAWETITDMTELDRDLYDPWATPGKRTTAITAMRDTILNN